MSTAMIPDLPLGWAIVLAVLVWAGVRIALALIEARSVRDRGSRVDEVLHYIDQVAVVAGDVLSALEDVGKDVAALRHAVEQATDERGAR